MGCGADAGFDLALVLIIPPKYWAGGAGEVAEDTDEESYDLVEGFGDRGYGLCDAAAMLEEPMDQWLLVLFGRDSTGFLEGEVPGGCLSRNMQTNFLFLGPSSSSSVLGRAGRRTSCESKGRL